MKPKYMMMKSIPGPCHPTDLYKNIRRHYFFSSRIHEADRRYVRIEPYFIITDGRDFFTYLYDNSNISLGYISHPTSRWILPIPYIKNKKFDSIVYDSIKKVLLDSPIKINDNPIQKKDIQIYETYMAFYNIENNSYHIIYFVVINPKSKIKINDSNIIMTDIIDTVTIGIKSGFMLKNKNIARLDLLSTAISALVASGDMPLPIIDTGDDYAWNKRIRKGGQSNRV